LFENQYKLIYFKYKINKMQVFNIYLELGFNHIIDLQSYDHILFVLTLCAVYVLRDWKHVLILVTAFTIGHTTTLALSTLSIISINSNIVEILIPITIFITAIVNIFYKKDEYSKKLHLFKYFTAMFFGLIHGLGFSNYLKSLLGSQENILKPLFAFNLGLEMGQIIIVSSILFASFIFINHLKSKRREWNLVISGAGIGISIILIIERIIAI